MIYIASPYTSPDAGIMHDRYRAVTEYASKLCRAGIPCYSPITHFHVMAELHDLPKDFEFWSMHNLAMLRRCDQVQVYKLPGWDKSKGVKKEVSWAASLHIPVAYINAPTS